MIVLDASAALPALLGTGPARSALASEQVHAPHLIDAEVASALRRLVSGGRIGPEAGWRALSTWQHLGTIRYPLVGLLERVWDLRNTLSPYDASYVALAEALECPLMTGDRRLARAAGLRCPVTVVPS